MNTKAKLPAENLKIGDTIRYELNLFGGGKHKRVQRQGEVTGFSETGHLVALKEVVTKTSLVHVEDIIGLVKQ